MDENTYNSLILADAKSKLVGTAYENLEALPKTRDDPLWQDIEDECNLWLYELGALMKNYAAPCPVLLAQPRMRRRVEDQGVLYQISSEDEEDSQQQHRATTFQISNPVSSCPYSFHVDILVDPSKNSNTTEFMLSARKVIQLGLVPVGRPILEYGSTTLLMQDFSPVLVTVTVDQDGETTAEPFQAYLSAKCDKNEYDRLLDEQGEGATGGNEERVETTLNQEPIHSSSSDNEDGEMVIPLSPTDHRLHDAPLHQAQAVIGAYGLYKLQLQLNHDRLQLEQIEGDESVADEWVENGW